jgi:hypothetical protein
MYFLHMNIFVLDKNPKLAAQQHNDKHCIKMILEHTQMLSTAIRVHSNDTVDGVYKKAHLNHPCSIWTRKSRSNFLWLCEMTEELFQEYTRRYGKQHKTYPIFQLCRNHANLIPDGEMTEFAQAMPLEYKNPDAVTAYRTYYIKDKKEFSTWKLGNTPNWWIV